MSFGRKLAPGTAEHAGVSLYAGFEYPVSHLPFDWVFGRGRARWLTAARRLIRRS